jgi:hypothetical protein
MSDAGHAYYSERIAAAYADRPDKVAAALDLPILRGAVALSTDRLVIQKQDSNYSGVHDAIDPACTQIDEVYARMSLVARPLSPGEYGSRHDPLTKVFVGALGRQIKRLRLSSGYIKNSSLQLLAPDEVPPLIELHNQRLHEPGKAGKRVTSVEERIIEGSTVASLLTAEVVASMGKVVGRLGCIGLVYSVETPQLELDSISRAVTRTGPLGIEKRTDAAFIMPAKVNTEWARLQGLTYH